MIKVNILQHLSAFLISLLLLAPPAIAYADPQMAAEQARQQTGGKVLSVTTSTDPPGYRVKVLLPDGRVRIVLIPS